MVTAMKPTIDDTPEIKQIAEAAGMSCRALALRFGIPRRTMEGWSAGVRTPPAYVLGMMREILKL